MSDEDQIKTQITTNALGPQSAETDGTKVTQFPLRDLIDAAKFAGNQGAKVDPVASLFRRKIVPPGAV